MIGASQNRHFSLVTIRILWEYIMSHDDQFHKFLFIISTTRVKRYDIVHEVDVESKYDRCTAHCRLGP